MKICLIFPPSPFLIDDHAMPPLGIMYLSAIAKYYGHEVIVCDDVKRNGYPKENIDLYGISVTTPQFHEAMGILNDIRSTCPSAKIIAGGPHATVLPDDLLNVGFDQVVVGEGERALLSILDGNCDKTIQDLHYTHGEMHLLLRPDRDCVDLHKYKYFIDGKKCTTMITQRGCPYGKCAFCCQVWKGTRYVPIASVCLEIVDIKEHGFDAVTLFDDIFFTMPVRDVEIMHFLKQHAIIWRALARSSTVLRHPDLIEEAGRTGCREIALGIESAHIDILETINKGVSLEDHKKAIEIIRKQGIRAKLNCIVGLPGESPASIEAMDHFLEEIDPDWVDVTCLSVFPGSDIWNHPEKYDLKHEFSYLPYKTIPGHYHCSVSTSKMTSEEILFARDYLEQKHRRGK